MNETQTGSQRRLPVAIAVTGVPLDAMVFQFRINRARDLRDCFDARRKIRAYLTTNGYLERADRLTKLLTNR